MKTYLTDLYETAYDAYRGTSFSPEKRAKNILSECEEQLQSYLNDLPAEYHENFIQGYRNKLIAWLNAKSRCLSPMITGPANFPTRRNEKANESERKRGNDFFEYPEKFLKRVKRAQERAKTPEESRADAFKYAKSQIEDSISTIIKIDTGVNTYTSRPLIVANLYGKIKTIIKRSDPILSGMVFDYLKELNDSPNLPKKIFTDRHGVWKMREETEAARERMVDRAEQESETFQFEGGEVVLNFGLDRLQIRHNEKPDYETRQQLKKAAFRWSPSNNCWQRQLTNNAKYAAETVTGVCLNV